MLWRINRKSADAFNPLPREFLSLFPAPATYYSITNPCKVLIATALPYSKEGFTNKYRGMRAYMKFAGYNLQHFIVIACFIKLANSQTDIFFRITAPQSINIARENPRNLSKAPRLNEYASCNRRMSYHVVNISLLLSGKTSGSPDFCKEAYLKTTMRAFPLSLP